MCCKRGCEIDDQCKHGMRGCLCLIAVLGYQLMCFIAFAAFSITISAIVSNVYTYLMDVTLPPACEQFVCMYMISIFAEFHIFCQRECVGRAFNSFYRDHTILLPMGTLFTYTMLYVLAFAELYLQFEETYINRAPTPRRRIIHKGNTSLTSNIEDESSIWGWEGGRTELHIALFLAALSFVVYTTMKIIQKDTIRQIKRITNQASCIHFVVTLGFLGVHSIINVLYAIPLSIIAFSMKLYRTEGPLCFVQLNVVGILSGMVFAVLETRRPWPLNMEVAPFYLYENNARAKTVFGQIQVLLILLCFYRPSQFPKIPQAEFNAGNNLVLYFCCAVAFCMLHFMKTFIYIALQRDDEPLINPGGFDALDEEDGDVEVIVDEDNYEEIVIDDDHIQPIPPDEICKRCEERELQNKGLDHANANDEGETPDKAPHSSNSHHRPKKHSVHSVSESYISEEFKLPQTNSILLPGQSKSSKSTSKVRVRFSEEIVYRETQESVTIPNFENNEESIRDRIDQNSNVPSEVKKVPPCSLSDPPTDKKKRDETVSIEDIDISKKESKGNT